jgi:hypothetical protein
MAKIMKCTKEWMRERTPKMTASILVRLKRISYIVLHYLESS